MRCKILIAGIWFNRVISCEYNSVVVLKTGYAWWAKTLTLIWLTDYPTAELKSLRAYGSWYFDDLKLDKDENCKLNSLLEDYLDQLDKLNRATKIKLALIPVNVVLPVAKIIKQ